MSVWARVIEHNKITDKKIKKIFIDKFFHTHRQQSNIFNPLDGGHFTTPKFTILNLDDSDWFYDGTGLAFYIKKTYRQKSKGRMMSNVQTGKSSKFLEMRSLFDLFKKKLRILMIEDDQDLNMLLKSTLQKHYNCRVDTATDPYEAMNCLTGKHYDLIVLDWQLPALNGGETLIEVEKGLADKKGTALPTDSKIPVLIFSGSPEEECNFTQTAHFNRVGYVSKQKSLHDICESFSQHFAFH